MEQTKLFSVIFSCCCCCCCCCFVVAVVVVFGGGGGGGLPKDLIQGGRVHGVSGRRLHGGGGGGDCCNYISRKMSVFITKVLTPPV